MEHNKGWPQGAAVCYVHEYMKNKTDSNRLAA